MSIVTNSPPKRALEVPTRRRLRWLLTAAGTLLVLGSPFYFFVLRPEAPGQLPVVAAGGTLLHLGKPVASATIVLVPDDEFKNLHRPRAVTGVDGAFTLGTYAASDGAPVGHYRVAIRAPAPEALDKKPKNAPLKKPGVKVSMVPQDLNRDRFHDRYSDHATSGLTVDIRADGPNRLELNLK